MPLSKIGINFKMLMFLMFFIHSLDQIITIKTFIIILNIYLL